MFVSRLFIAIFSFKLGTTENPQVRRDTTNEAKIKKKRRGRRSICRSSGIISTSGVDEKNQSHSKLVPCATSDSYVDASQSVALSLISVRSLSLTQGYTEVPMSVCRFVLFFAGFAGWLVFGEARYLSATRHHSL